MDALRCQHLGRVALDVLEQEPPPRQHMDHGLDNLLITPHVAFNSEEAIEDLQLQSARTGVDVLQGKEPVYWANRW